MIKAEHITKSLTGRVILRDVDIAIEPGKITVVIGPSGSGKTTLLRALSLLDPPDSGIISLDGTLYRFPKDPAIDYELPWPRLTTVFQQLFLWPHLTLRRNIALPLEQRYSENQSSTRLDKIIEAFDMAEFIDRYPNQASLGQRQRVALARALVLEPQYILLDEITSALDVEHITKILAYLRMLRERRIGVLLITHLLGFARNAADYVVFLDDGRVLESGGTEVLKSPRHERVASFIAVIEAAR